ncbi:MAG: hypothetical protein ACO1PN_11350 [Betaproteobacteria bacterium]
MQRFLKDCILVFLELVWLPALIGAALVARFWPKRKTVGLGPEPLINNVYHARALRKLGWDAETFVDSLYFITSEFDVKLIFRNNLLAKLTRLLFAPFLFSIFRYRIIYIYFNGGGLYAARALWILEPLLYRLADVKVVVMPYGGDVQDAQKSGSLCFKHAIDKDYPNHFRRRNIIRTKVWIWSLWADHVISGCDWVDYMQHWDTLCISHFSIDLEDWKFQSAPSKEGHILRILHAPNHKNIKGTRFFEEAVSQLRKEGILVELVMAQGLPNSELRRLIEDCDVVADQLIIGWYAMFAIEGMAMGKPVLCYVRDDLEELYVQAGLLDRGELPLIKCNPMNVKDVIRSIALTPTSGLSSLGQRGRAYVERRHSLHSIGAMFGTINESLGIRQDA